MLYMASSPGALAPAEDAGSSECLLGGHNPKVPTLVGSRGPDRSAR